METNLPISTISYNTLPFLNSTLQELVNTEKIEWYNIAPHKGEPDEQNDDHKDHAHVLIYPHKKIDTVQLRKLFVEHDPTNEKPLGCLPFKKSKTFADWYLYALHDPVYLATKGQSRTYTYTKEDIITSDADYLEYQIREMKPSEYNRYIELKQYQDKGYSFPEFIMAKNIPVSQVYGYREVWYMLEKYEYYTNRNGRPTHKIEDVTKKEDEEIEQNESIEIEPKHEVIGINDKKDNEMFTKDEVIALLKDQKKAFINNVDNCVNNEMKRMINQKNEQIRKLVIMNDKLLKNKSEKK